jgi:dimethylargininase
VCLNGRVLIARGFPLLEKALVKLRYDVVTLEMSEFRKMDGGLSCLSLRL